MRKLLFIAAALVPLPASAQAPEPKVSVPVSLLQDLINVGQAAPGKEINPLTERVKALVNEQLAPKKTAGAEKPAVQEQTPAGMGKPAAKPAEPEKP